MRFNVPFGISVKTLFVLFFTATLLTAQVTVIKGKLLDVNGKPSKFGMVGTLPQNNQFADYFAKCDKSGNYTIKLTKPGLNQLLYSMPGHSALIIPVNNNKDKSFSIDVTLAPYKYIDKIDNSSAMGNFSNFKAVPLKKQDNGTFILEVNIDKKDLWYQIVGIEKYGRTTNPPGCDKYAPDSTGDYYAVVPVKDGKAVILFDPSKLLKSDKEIKVTFKGSKYDEKLFSIYNEFSQIEKDASQKIRDFYDINKNTAEFHYEKGNYFTDFLNKIDTENDHELKNYLKLLYISYYPFSPNGYSYEKAASFFSSVDPSDPVWDMMPQAFYAYGRLFPQNKWNEITNEFLNKTKSKDLTLLILKEKLTNAKYSGNEEEFKKTHAAIEKDYSNDKETRNFLKRFPLETKVKVGADIPDFEVASIENPGVKYSKQNMLGKIYLMDFWATWCGPCVHEMETLHKAYDKYKDKGFEIISLSMDADAETVNKFRKEKWSMPWKNVFLEYDEQSKARDRFEVMGIPRPILIDANGKILAMEEELRGENLDKTLDKYFSK